MNSTDQVRASSAAALASEWYDALQLEARSDDGDPEAYISSVRELAERAEPGSFTHGAFAVLMERLREDDVDLEEDAPE